MTGGDGEDGKEGMRMVRMLSCAVMKFNICSNSLFLLLLGNEELLRNLPEGERPCRQQSRHLVFNISYPEWGEKGRKRARIIPGGSGAGQSLGAAHPCFPQPSLAELRGVTLASPLLSASLLPKISKTNHLWEQKLVFCSFLPRVSHFQLCCVVTVHAKGPRCPPGVRGPGPAPQSVWREPLCTSTLPRDIPGAAASVSPAGALGRPTHSRAQD